MNRGLLMMVSLPVGALLTSVLLGYGRGAFPGTKGTAGTVPANVTRATPSCGLCHRMFAGGANLKVFATPSRRVLDKSQSASILVSATGGAPDPKKWGGFVAEVTRGKLTAGTNSQVDSTGRFATHKFAFTSNNRRWQFGYTAPATAGPVQLYAVVNTVDGNGRAGPGDFWGFHGFDSGSIRSTPVALYVNETGVRALGTACADGFGNVPVLGAKQTPRVGNGAFALELLGTITNAPATLVLGANPNFRPVDLSIIGMPGCTLYVDVVFSAQTTTSAGSAQHADGSAVFPLPIANDPGFRGAKIQAQAAILGPVAGRSLPLTLTNGLSITIQ